MSPRAACYEIRVAEPLEPRWQQWFPEMDIAASDSPSAPGTWLRGRLPDQAALFGLLARIRDLNLTLLEVKKVE